MASIPAEKRKKTATVKVDGKSKFPIFSKHSAQSALRLEGHARPPLTSEQKEAIERKAARYGVHARRDDDQKQDKQEKNRRKDDEKKEEKKEKKKVAKKEER